MIAQCLAIIISYLIGSIPTAYLVGKLIRGKDVRYEGSGNVGATNVFRVVGKFPGIVVLLFDITKGVAAVTLIGDFFTRFDVILAEECFRIILGFAVVCGHNWTVFLHFRGGKGVATGAGVLLGLAARVSALWPVLVLTVFVWGLVFLLTHYVSLASIIATVSLPLWMVVFNQPFRLVLFSAILCFFIVFKHRSNIRRLLRREEKKIGRKAKTGGQ